MPIDLSPFDNMGTAKGMTGSSSSLSRCRGIGDIWTRCTPT
jgi:hypothetical protein